MEILTNQHFAEGEAHQLSLFTLPSTQTSIHSIFYSDERASTQLIPDEGPIKVQNMWTCLDLACI